MITNRTLLSIVISTVIITIFSCNRPAEAGKHEPDEQTMSTGEFIQEDLRFKFNSTDGWRSLPDSGKAVFMEDALRYYYGAHQYQPVWIDTGRWTNHATVLMSYLDTCAYDGLFKNDYHAIEIRNLQDSLLKDSLSMLDGKLWVQTDILLTDAFMRIILDLKQGRLQPDSLSWKYDTSRHRTFFAAYLDSFRALNNMNAISSSMQPAWPGYASLRTSIPGFVRSLDTGRYTKLEFPFIRGDATDSMRFYRQLRVRLSESKFNLPPGKDERDSTLLSAIIAQYQKKHQLTVDGKAGPALVRSLNLTDSMKFRMIAATIDKYKKLPQQVPEKFILVNLPAFMLRVWDTDSIAFESRVICGKPITPTPVLQAAISDLVIYPTWTVPESIIKKELLPGLKKNPGYLGKKGLNLYDSKGDMVDPTTINWSKYVKGIPYIVRQGSGDNNALGVIKFNFDNPYQVYLHDTNQRNLFRNAFRAMSHGCVRVQEWEKLSQFILQYDSLKMKTTDTLRYNFDSVKTWIAEKQKHRVFIKNRLPLYIRYMTCEARDGNVVFYDDIYNDDKKLIDAFFAGK